MNERLTSRGLVFDLFAFIGNIVIVPTLIEMATNPNGFSRFFGFALIAATLAYAVGLTLKSSALRARLCRGVEEPEPAFIWYFFLFVLFVMHWGLFLTCFSIGMESLGIPLSEAGPFSIAIFFIGGSIPTTLTLVAVIPSENHQTMQSKTDSIKESIGDCLLFLALMVIFALWEGLFVQALIGKGSDNIFMGILLTILVTVPFAMFYLAPRIPFLVEDYKKRSTWIQIFLVVAPLAYRLIMPDI